MNRRTLVVTCVMVSIAVLTLAGATSIIWQQKRSVTSADTGTHPTALKCKEAIVYRWSPEETAREVGMPDFWSNVGETKVFRYDLHSPDSSAPVCAMIFFDKKAKYMTMMERSVAQRHYTWVSTRPSDRVSQ